MINGQSSVFYQTKVVYIVAFGNEGEGKPIDCFESSLFQFIQICSLRNLSNYSQQMHDFLQGYILIVYFNVECCLFFLCFSIVNPEPHMREPHYSLLQISPPNLILREMPSVFLLLRHTILTHSNQTKLYHEEGEMTTKFHYFFINL